MADRESTTDPPTTEAGTKRTRPWLRRVGVVVGCLLAGAIINVLVAWGCALWGSYVFPSQRMFSHEDAPCWHGQVNVGLGVTRVSAVPHGRYWGGDGTEVYVPEGFPRWSKPSSERPTAELLNDIRMPWTIEFGLGWPWRSCYGAASRNVQLDDGTRNPSHRFKAEWGLEFGDDGSGAPMPFRLIPLYPLFGGFAANSLFYALLLWIPFAAAHSIRRFRRKRRGLCPDCGYDLRGADHGKCPECGKAVGVK